MVLGFNWDAVTCDQIGVRGICDEDFQALAPKVKDARAIMKQQRDSGEIGFWTLPYDLDTLEKVKCLAAEIREDFDHFVILGIGGSALGPLSLHAALKSTQYNQLPAAKRNGPKMYFVDNVDPVLFNDLKEVLDLSKTCFCVITKSGSTSETMAGYLIARGWVENELGKDQVAKHFVGITDPEKGFLRELINKEGWKSLEVPPNVGGRFSIFTPVGLLSAAVEGIDVDALLEGAREMDQHAGEQDLLNNIPQLHGAIQYLSYMKGRNISVMLPYANRLYLIADWYRQLWAESLGKKCDLDGNEVYVGQTPVKSLGTTDQHSQIQLYVEGPDDKITTFIQVQNCQSDVEMPNLHPDNDGIAYLGNKPISSLLNAECEATQWALTQHSRPNCVFSLPEISEFYLGQLYFLLEVETAFVGGLLNINPYDQPGVESGKIATYQKMGRKGYC